MLMDILLMTNCEILGVTLPHSETETVLDAPVLGQDQQILHHSPNEVMLVNAIGYVGRSRKRINIYHFFKERGYRFHTVIHPSAIISSYTQLGEGVQIMAGAILQAGTSVGCNAVVNTKASVDHDCWVGAHTHIAPGSTLCGHVRLGEESFVGAGAVLLPHKEVGNRCTIGAGSVVVKDVPDDTVVMGVPAEEGKHE
ncbi:carbonic anhydrase [Xylanibacillus composti]|uniref:Carbonic anhydrase n=1 Tax=Xylanibacillus composti TaxID=1572762 RepID=A0A8J4H5M0_9BACL|nr:carbonic anhydrase [Xylanibacillus composti]